MAMLLGIDVGAFESKGALVDDAGRIVAQAVAPDKMIVPRQGWAEHRIGAEWWGDTIADLERWNTRPLAELAG